MGNTPTPQADKKLPLVASSDEIIKNKQFGMPISFLSRHERVSFSAMIKIAYDDIMANPLQSEFKIPTKDFMRMIGIDVRKWKYTSLFIREKEVDDPFSEDGKGKMKVATDDYAVERTLMGLLGKEVSMRYKNEDGVTYEVKATVLVSDFTINKENVTFSFGKWVRDNIVVVGNVYTSQMETLTMIKSTYSVALYEQIEQRRKFREWKIGVVAFRAIMGIEDENKYKRFSNLRARVIDKAIKEIEEHTEYKISVETEKKGVRIVKIIFRWYIDEERKNFVKWKKKIRKTFLGKKLFKDGDTYICVGKMGYLHKENETDFLEKHHSVNLWKYLYENQDKIIGNNKATPTIKKNIENKGSPSNITRNNETIEIAKKYKMEEDEEYHFNRFKRHYISLDRSRKSWIEVWENWIEGEARKEKDKKFDLFSIQTAEKQKLHTDIQTDKEIREKLKIAGIVADDVLGGKVVSDEIAYKYIKTEKGEVGVFYYTREVKEGGNYIEAEIE